MNRDNIAAVVRLGAPVPLAELRAIREHPEVTKVEATRLQKLGEGGEDLWQIDAVHFTAPTGPPRSYPDSIESPLDPPTVGGTDISRPV